MDLWSPCGVHMESVGEGKVQGNKHPQQSSLAPSTNSPSVILKANMSPLPRSDIVREEGVFEVLYDFD